MTSKLNNLADFDNRIHSNALIAVLGYQLFQSRRRDGPHIILRGGNTTFTLCSLTTIVRFLLLIVIYALLFLIHILNFISGFCIEENRLCIHTVFRATCNVRQHLRLGTHTPKV